MLILSDEGQLKERRKNMFLYDQDFVVELFDDDAFLELELY